MSNAYAAVSALLFAILAVMHLVRIIGRWSVVIGPNNISMNVSWLALVVSALLSKRLGCQKPAETFRLGENRNWELIIPIGPNN